MKKAAEAKYQINRFTLSSLRASAGSVAISCRVMACMKRDRHVVPLRGTRRDDDFFHSCVKRGFSTSPQAGVHKSHEQYYVYILDSKRNGTLYIGVTNDLLKRVFQHKSDVIEGFTKKYQVHQLVYYDVHHDVKQAISREKRMKKWKRQWKITLIEQSNPHWEDLYDSLIGCSGSPPSRG